MSKNTQFTICSDKNFRRCLKYYLNLHKWLFDIQTKGAERVLCHFSCACHSENWKLAWLQAAKKDINILLKLEMYDVDLFVRLVKQNRLNFDILFNKFPFKYYCGCKVSHANDRYMHCKNSLKSNLEKYIIEHIDFSVIEFATNRISYFYYTDYGEKALPFLAKSKYLSKDNKIELCKHTMENFPKYANIFEHDVEIVKGTLLRYRPDFVTKISQEYQSRIDAFKINPMTAEYMKNDDIPQNLIIQTLRNNSNPAFLKYLSQNRDLCLAIVKDENISCNCQVFAYFNAEFQNDIEIFKNAVYKNYLFYLYIKIHTWEMFRYMCIRYGDLKISRKNNEIINFLFEDDKPIIDREWLKFYLQHVAMGIKFIENPDNELQKIAIEKFALSIGNIQNPTIENQELAISLNPISIFVIKDPSQKLCMLALDGFDNSSERALYWNYEDLYICYKYKGWFNDQCFILFKLYQLSLKEIKHHEVKKRIIRKYPELISDVTDLELQCIGLELNPLLIKNFNVLEPEIVEFVIKIARSINIYEIAFKCKDKMTLEQKKYALTLNVECIKLFEYHSELYDMYKKITNYYYSSWDELRRKDYILNV